MFSRSATRLTAWAALIAVVFVVLLPATLDAAGKLSGASVLHGLSGICTVDGTMTLPQVPDQQPAVTRHKPCLFCTSSAPVFADANTPRVAVIEGLPVVVGPVRAEALPPDGAATQPLSPRAPPPRPH